MQYAVQIWNKIKELCLKFFVKMYKTGIFRFAILSFYPFACLRIRTASRNKTIPQNLFTPFIWKTEYG
jgi:hypothetical protein